MVNCGRIGDYGAKKQPERLIITAFKTCFLKTLTTFIQHSGQPCTGFISLLANPRSRRRIRRFILIYALIFHYSIYG